MARISCWLLLLIVTFAGLNLAYPNFASAAEPAASKPAPVKPLAIKWADNYLTISAPHIPGGEVKILYLEAYCRPGSTDRDWAETVIGHKAELVAVEREGSVIRLRDRLKDGVIVEHTITASDDEVDFQLVAYNPTKEASLAHWAQPCMRVDKFTGTSAPGGSASGNSASGNSAADFRALVPKYAEKSFLFIDGKQAMLPTKPWADKARYIPGQVYCPAHVDRADVNPRPLSTLVPSNGLMGCYSADNKQILAVAWEPYQELFQGVIGCLHNDFRIGGLKPGETKKIRGKVYIVPADLAKLQARFEKDFSEQVSVKASGNRND